MQKITQVCGATCIAAAVVVTTSTASADYILDHSQLTEGENAASISFAAGEMMVDVMSVGGDFASKTVHGVTGMGVSGGPVHGEISGDQQMTLTFSQAVEITSLEIAHLYTAGNFGDVWNEVALFQTDIGDFYLEAASPTVGDWTGSGTLENTSPGEEGHGGAWRVSGEDIFGGPITTLTLMPGNAGNHHKYGDFSFVQLQAAAVPTPGALAMLFSAAVTGRPRRRRV